MLVIIFILNSILNFVMFHYWNRKILFSKT